MAIIRLKVEIRATGCANHGPSNTENAAPWISPNPFFKFDDLRSQVSEHHG
jgi:hypothetical protein